MPLAAFEVNDIAAEHARLVAAGVAFTMPPTKAGAVEMARFAVTCGNLIQIYQLL